MSNLYRALWANLIRIDSELTLVTTHRRPGAIAIDHLSAGILRLCSAERSLDAHVEHVTNALVSCDPAVVRGTVGRLVSMGLLQVVAEPGPTRPSETRDRLAIRTLAIVTAGRPGALARCIASYLTYLDRTDPAGSVRLLVVDGSRHAGAAEANGQMTTDARRSTGRPVVYAGARARASHREGLRSRGVPDAVIDWLFGAAIHAPTPGATRNHLLLETAGKPVLSVDDDTIAGVWGGGTRDDELALAGHFDVRDTHFFASRQEAIAAALLHEGGDLLAAHERLLGRGVADLAAQARPRLDTSEVCWHVLPVLEGVRPEWAVRATCSALAGDSAVYCPYPFLFATGPTRDRLASSPEALQLALATREVTRAVHRPTVADEPWLMTYCAGLDNRSPLPPFSPLGANEDGLFGAMLRMCEPGAFVGQVPMGVMHDSARDSRYDEGAVRSARDLRINDLVQWMCAPMAGVTVETDVRARTRLLGEHLMACGRLTPAAWRGFVALTVAEARRRVLATAETMLAGPFAYPPFWRDALRRYQQAVLDGLSSPRSVVPLEFADGATADAALEAAQAYVRAFGEALTFWPDIRDEAASRNQSTSNS